MGNLVLNRWSLTTRLPYSYHTANERTVNERTVNERTVNERYPHNVYKYYLKYWRMQNLESLVFRSSKLDFGVRLLNFLKDNYANSKKIVSINLNYNLFDNNNKSNCTKNAKIWIYVDILLTIRLTFRSSIQPCFPKKWRINISLFSISDEFKKNR